MLNINGKGLIARIGTPPRKSDQNYFWTIFQKKICLATHTTPDVSHVWFGLVWSGRVVWLKYYESSKSATFSDIGAIGQFCRCPSRPGVMAKILVEEHLEQ